MIKTEKLVRRPVSAMAGPTTPGRAPWRKRSGTITSTFWSTPPSPRWRHSTSNYEPASVLTAVAAVNRAQYINLVSLRARRSAAGTPSTERTTKIDGPPTERGHEGGVMRKSLIGAVAIAVLILSSIAPAGALARQHPVAVPHGPAPFGNQSRSVCPNVPGKAHCFAMVVTSGGTRTAVVHNTPSGYGPVDLQTAYGLGSLSATGGSGQTIAIVDAYDDPVAEGDLATYRSTYGLSPCTTANGCFRKVDQNGGTSYPPVDYGWSDEVSLDLDMVSAIAPNAHIVLVEGNDASFVNLGLSVNEAVSLGATQVSNSYGGNEFYANLSGAPPYYNHPGTAILASSGDAGYYGDGAYAQFPASSPTVEAVGGTSLFTVAPRTESVWGYAGSGCSQLFSKPAWQTDPSCPNRMVADVSADADPLTGVAVYDSNPDIGGWAVLGGTSASSPMLAGVDALVGSAASTPQWPYQNVNYWNDVTTGNNDCCAPPSLIAAYFDNGVVGYDGPTGLGTPNGAAITPPTASIASPTNGAVYTQGQTVFANYSCVEGANGPGLGSCVGPVQNGQAINTATLGVSTFTVVATSGDGLTGSATATYTVNAAPPPTPSPPTASISSPTNGAVYTQGQAVFANYSCAEGANGPGLGSCVGPVQTGQAIKTATLGVNTFTVVATSGDGLTGSATATYTVNAAPPPPAVPRITAHPAASTASRTATFRFTDSDTRAVVYGCSLDGRESTCHSPQGYGNLSVGRHTFRVFAAVGALQGGSAQYVWTVLYPAPRITAHPASRTRSQTATFRFTYGSKGVTFKCRLDRHGPWRACKGSVRYTKLARNRAHTFEVSAVVNGKTSQVTSFTWKVVR
jgi:hypothetical protein